MISKIISMFRKPNKMQPIGPSIMRALNSNVIAEASNLENSTHIKNVSAVMATVQPNNHQVNYRRRNGFR